MKILFLLTTSFIIYGSLYPFDFQLTEDEVSTLDALTRSLYERTHLGDLLGNVVIFIPFGYFGVLAVTRIRSLLHCIIAITLLGIVLAVGLQVAQMYLPLRNASLQDAIWNVLGIIIGGILGGMLRVHSDSLSIRRANWAITPVLLIGGWIGYRLMPFIPTLDWQEIKNSLKPLLLDPSVSAVNIYHDAVAWAIVAYLWAAAVPMKHYERYLILTVPVVFGLEILITNNSVSASNVVGAIVGIALWWMLIKHLRVRAGILAVMLIIMLIAIGLAPFELSVWSATFHWLPFYGFLGGSMLLNTTVLFEKFFLYGSLVWLLQETGAGIRMAAIYSMLIVAGIELAQTRFIMHTAEITDPILVIVVAFIIHTMDSYKGISRKPNFSYETNHATSRKGRDLQRML